MDDAWWVIGMVALWALPFVVGAVVLRRRWKHGAVVLAAAPIAIGVLVIVAVFANPLNLC
ncbi:hypothetical protein [Nocardia ninae]|uniref:Uncharacterized protein n=1 Tax=Nocardia ninae NBRC 108245 TaxID=1210091 RepID=A0A511MS75_9NOCA|nr:hypothetical protein [Nocardia ninae]GEM43452.1 hypothetical protein NN4_79710 [Nocardia ninae NBRC 108245]